MMKSSDYYRSLPDSMTPEAIQCELEALLLVNMEMSSLQFMEALEELADRQWHTYTLLASPLMARVEQLIISRLQDQPEVTESAISIVSRLGLVRVWSFLLGLDRQVVSPASRKAIEEAEIEMASTIADPYSGMRTKD